MKYFFYILIAAVALGGCTKKTDNLFEETPDERLARALSAYHTALREAPGWKLFVYPSGLASQGIDVGGLTYYVTFPDSNRTRMVSDFNLAMAATPKESGFRLRAIQRPSLVFDTYSYIHVAADPDEIVSSSPADVGGFGWGTDFDFAFTRAEPSDSMTLEGNFNRSTAYLLRATQEEIDAAFGGRLANILQWTEDYIAGNDFLYFPSTDNQRVGISFNTYLYRLNFNYLSEGNITTFSAPFSYTVQGIHFRQPVTVGGHTFQDMIWDDAQSKYYISLADGGRLDIVSTTQPIFPFNQAIGSLFTTITIPTTPLPGQSDLYQDVYEEMRNDLINGPYALTLGQISMVFDNQSKTMAMTMIVFQGNSGFQAQYVYSYGFNSAGNVDFQLTGFNRNAELIADDTRGFRDYLEQDILRMDYFSSPSGMLGQLRSQDEPDFFFTGTLR